MKIRKSASQILFEILGYSYASLWALFCVLPFLLILSGSFTDDKIIRKEGYSILPRGFTLQAYKMVFEKKKKILRAYGVTFFITIVGTVAGLFVISMAGYALQRSTMKYRNQIAFYIYFTTLFSGGLIPWYIMVANVMGLKNSIYAQIIPSLMNPFLIFLMRNFLRTIPESIVESARIDGAGDFLIYRALILPIATPALATVGLFLALGYWNNWFLSAIFIENETLFSLQFYLYNILARADFIRSSLTQMISVNIELPRESVKLATAVVTTGPVIFFYPFVQKYFVQGLVIGAVKG
jgi:putative aldouronate transport system permease protein